MEEHYLCGEIREILEKIVPADKKAYRLSEERWSHIAKPLGSLGMLETIVSGMAAAQSTGRPAEEVLRGVSGGSLPDISRRTLVIFCADNGVIKEGVTQTGAEVTAAVTGNITRGRSCSSLMAERAGVQVIPVDVGIRCEVTDEGKVHPLAYRKIRRGTDSFAEGPAMSREEFLQAFLIGAAFAEAEKKAGCGLLIGGEMGIGNSSTSAAVLSCLLDISPREAAGRGAGLSDEGLEKKVRVIEKGIVVNRPDPDNPADVLQKLGGFDLAAMTGFYLSAAALRIPVLLDGILSLAAAVCAVKMKPEAGDYLFATHETTEPAGRKALNFLGKNALLQGGLHLGEGTGALTMVPMLDMALNVYRKMDTFRQMNIEEYRRLC